MINCWVDMVDITCGNIGRYGVLIDGNNAAGYMMKHIHVVCDKDNGHLVLLTNAINKLKYSCLCVYIKCSGGFVRDK